MIDIVTVKLKYVWDQIFHKNDLIGEISPNILFYYYLQNRYNKSYMHTYCIWSLTHTNDEEINIFEKKNRFNNFGDRHLIQCW